METVFNTSNTAVITGGASGIGLALAAKCLGHGMRVVVADRNIALLDRAKKTLGDELTTLEMDVASIEDWEKLHKVVYNKLGGQVNLLALNAGIGLKSGWEDLDSVRSILDTNLYGVINGIHTMLPAVKESAQSTRAAIVITGSKQGITNPPGNPAYNASKAAVKAVAEHLSYDLKATNIGVHLLVPGWTFTGLSGGAPGSTIEKPAGAWSPEQVVAFLEQGMAKGSFYIICPDNEVTEEMDRKRMLWSTGDIVHDRPALSRWRPEFKDDVQEWMDKPTL